MAQLGLKIVGADGSVKASVFDSDEVTLVYRGSYEEGDSILFSCDEPEQLYSINVDPAIGAALVYVAKEEVIYRIPFGEKKVCYYPLAFAGELHLVTARRAYEWERTSYRNMAVNVMDQHSDSGCFPHAFANVETRNESVFAARNAIDGCHANQGHGAWPYGSWGISHRDDAEMVINFGREIWADSLIIYTRADFPHDSWWVGATLEFSDETELQIELQKTVQGQRITLPEPKIISWVKLKDMIKAADPSPYPALSQIEVYGREIE